MVPSLAKQKPTFRWAVLILTSMMTFGNLYSIDNVATIKPFLSHYFLKYDIGFSNIEFGVGLYSSLFVANSFMPFITGILIDRYSLRSAILVLGII